MITRSKLAGLAALLLTASIGLAQTKTTPATPAPAATKAPAAAKAPAVTTHVMNGTVDSISGTGAAMTVVIKPAKSTDKPLTLMLNASTTKTGDLAQGAKVSAHYHVDNGQNIATSITVSPVKTAAAAKAPAAKPAPAAKTK